MARYRWRTALRARAPWALNRFIPKGRRGCGNHEWYRHSWREWCCYHCVATTDTCPWSDEELARRRRELAEAMGCTCGRVARGLTCRCTCSKCGSRNLKWEAWGSYLDKELNCGDCGHLQDTWDC